MDSSTPAPSLQPVEVGKGNQWPINWFHFHWSAWKLPSQAGHVVSTACCKQDELVKSCQKTTCSGLHTCTCRIIPHASEQGNQFQKHRPGDLSLVSLDPEHNHLHNSTKKPTNTQDKWTWTNQGEAISYMQLVYANVHVYSQYVHIMLCVSNKLLAHTGKHMPWR